MSLFCLRPLLTPSSFQDSVQFSIKALRADSPARYWPRVPPCSLLTLTFWLHQRLRFPCPPTCRVCCSTSRQRRWRTEPTLTVCFRCLFSLLSCLCLHSVTACPVLNCYHDLFIQRPLLHIGSLVLDSVQHLASHQ